MANKWIAWAAASMLALASVPAMARTHGKPAHTAPTTQKLTKASIAAAKHHKSNVTRKKHAKLTSKKAKHAQASVSKAKHSRLSARSSKR